MAIITLSRAGRVSL